MDLVAEIIYRIIQLFTLVVIVDVMLSYFMDPYHPVRQTLDGIVNPLLNPIRKVIPAVGMMDFSPLVLIILLQIVGRLIYSILRSF